MIFTYSVFREKAWGRKSRGKGKNLSDQERYNSEAAI
jgi:hypothetical protein